MHLATPISNQLSSLTGLEKEEISLTAIIHLVLLN